MKAGVLSRKSKSLATRLLRIPHRKQIETNGTLVKEEKKHKQDFKNSRGKQAKGRSRNGGKQMMLDTKIEWK